EGNCFISVIKLLLHFSCCLYSRCFCSPGWTGVDCAQDVNECDSGPCLNGFSCTCSPFFTVLCDLDVNECEVSPCLHEGICINTPGGFKCICRPGYTGLLCEVNINECLSSPCYNGGRCIDGPNQYHCCCPPGFMGDFCEVDVNECCSAPLCHNGGQCKATGADSFICTCPSLWTGSLCNQSVSCVNNNCRHGSICAPANMLSYRCICLLGWGGTYCDTKIFNTRNLKFTQVSFSVYASSSDGLIVWLGMAEQEDDDYLAVGLEEGNLKIAVNLGERLTLPITLKNHSFCCRKWHNVSLNLNRTVIQVFLNNEEILFEDLDPFERYVALNSGGVAYFGGFEFYKNVSVVTSGIFSKGFEGNIRNVFLFGDGNPVLFHKNSEGFNIFEGTE
uniref:Crumbs cell polarity complex component 2b n=1 Tax=Xiphophorus couchianus TaxID=32473 RepID=A0A3B5M766_9TELE